MIHPFRGTKPDAERASFVAWNAEVLGAVTLDEESSVWFGATIRGDIEPIHVGRGSNVQDSASLHTDRGAPLSIGDNVTIGHNAVVHGCTIEDECLIGMGAVVLNRAVIARHSIVGAGALVTEGKSFPERSLIIGSPAKAVRTVTDDEVARLLENAANYRARARLMRAEGAGEPPAALRRT